MNVIETAGLGRRYWKTWALRDCTLAIPAGRVTALTGPNGAGKTTLMHMAVGLTAPTEGRVTVLGGRAAGSPEALKRMAFVAQDVPLYQHLPVEDMVRLARVLNGRHWDQRRADQRLAALGIPLRRRVGRLSGGQQAQVALTIALARRPEFLVLDEPLARLDPLARHEFLASVMETAAEDGTSVLFSSHVVAELERAADYLVVLTGGRVQVAGDVEVLLAFAIGVLAGALIRRVVAAMAVTAICTVTVASLTYNRLHYWLLAQGTDLARDRAFGAAPNVGDLSGGILTIHETVGHSTPGPAGAWLDQGWYTDASGHRLGDGAVNHLLNKYTGTGPAWLTRLHDTFWVTYQPGSRYWLFQLILAGGTLLAAVALAAATITLIRHRRA